jgi:FG-GAP-like repeat/FG-GAP repeat
MRMSPLGSGRRSGHRSTVILIFAIGVGGCGSNSVIGHQTGLGGNAGTGSGGHNSLGGAGGRGGINGLGGVNGLGGTTGTAGSDGLGGTTGVAGGNGFGGTTGVAGGNGFGGTTGLGGNGEICPVGSGGPPDAGVAFPTAVEYPTNRGSFSVALGDLNGDGKLDLAVANLKAQDQSSAGGANGSSSGAGGGPPNPGGVGIFLSGAASGFAAPQYYMPDTMPSSLAVGDLNGDGKADLVVANNRNVTVLFNTGSGNLGTPVSFSVGNYPTSIAIGDLNGDGKADLAVANSGDSSAGLMGDVGILLNMGSGTFVAYNYPAGTSPVALAIGDLNGDGKPDLAVASGAAVSVLLNNGSGGFAAAASYGTGTRPYSVAIGDLNGDGKPDLAVTNLNVSGASVLLNVGNGTFAAAVDYGYSSDSGSYLGTVAIGDLNGDGKPDLVAAAPASPCGTLAVWLNLGNGSFRSPFNLTVGQDPASSVVLGDLNGDGKPDLIVPNGVGVGVLLNAHP